MPACVLKFDLPNTPQINIGPKYFQNLAYVKFYLVHASSTHKLCFLHRNLDEHNTYVINIDGAKVSVEYSSCCSYGNYTFSSNLQLTIRIANTPSNV